ncbi:hypothetical protein Xcel_0569 [Xylanimonas cellulosilytica DSM 15894]|uniref:Uncharacterized protein n=1 Tax=Xylanimonas cellulosilytica (strain DSM 15894 / JCM 12276 / CECT 5975 / KCTC 9989 / LMG 20990 / NBRC 107835 / XIL07) TaxID=446471 RepID=D1BWM6_XYLCX|nr:hypothetical protein [Xylanimonas cellulosilytica]ACZ29608.1 hypothetical protein Xcel_0569 [Xylanimonas cellulosilytica DSM 15894]
MSHTITVDVEKRLNPHGGFRWHARPRCLDCDWTGTPARHDKRTLAVEHAHRIAAGHTRQQVAA